MRYVRRWNTKKVLGSVVGSVTIYRYGFNGQEKDDEVSGAGNSYTALFWQYDSRLGKRWNLDTDWKLFPHKSPFSTFSNNPIIYVDPLGNTDFYNLNAEKIGSDGVNNGINLLVLKPSTERQIKRGVRKNGLIVLSAKQESNTIPVPNDEFMNNVGDALAAASVPLVVNKKLIHLPT